MAGPIDRTVSMSSADKVAEAMRRSLPYLPGEARGVVESLLQPATLAIVTGTVVLWAGSHFVGVGEVVDIILLVVGAVALGFAVFEGAGALYEFATTSIGARTSADLDRAGRHFARAVTILGISTVQAVLLRGQAKPVLRRGAPRRRPMPSVGNPPRAGNRLRLSRPSSLPDGTLGTTNAYGAITVARNQPLSEQRATLLHELVHRFFSPRIGPLRKLRAQLGISAYARSAILRYIEEGLAEGYAQLRLHGLARALSSYRFPIDGGYMTVSQLAGEGTTIGTVVLGGTLFHVSITVGPGKAR